MKLLCCADGVTFAGIGGSLRYKRSNYMFLTQQQSIDVAKKLPRADVLITHDKAYIGWFVDAKSQYAKDPHAGLVGISKYIRKNKPRYHLYGHLHQRMTEEKHGMTSMCVYGIQLIEIGGVTQTRVIEKLVDEAWIRGGRKAD